MVSCAFQFNVEGSFFMPLIERDRDGCEKERERGWHAVKSHESDSNLHQMSYRGAHDEALKLKVGLVVSLKSCSTLKYVLLRNTWTSHVKKCLRLEDVCLIQREDECIRSNLCNLPVSHTSNPSRLRGEQGDKKKSYFYPHCSHG